MAQASQYKNFGLPLWSTKKNSIPSGLNERCERLAFPVRFVQARWPANVCTGVLSILVTTRDVLDYSALACMPLFVEKLVDTTDISSLSSASIR